MTANAASASLAKYMNHQERQDIEKETKNRNRGNAFAKATITAAESAGHHRLNQHLHTQQSELSQDQRVLQKLNEREAETTRMAQETLLAEQLAKLRNDKLRDEKERLRLRQENEELRQLERQLYQAYINKERHLQVQEKRLNRHQQQLEKQKEKEALDAFKKKSDFEAQEEERQRLVNSTQYIEGLKQQFVERDLRKEGEFKQFLKEKAMVGDIVQQIEDEEKRMAQERAERMERARREMEEELATRRRLRDELKLQSEAQNRLACDYWAELERRDAAIEAARRRRLDELHALQQRLGGRLERHRRCRQEELQLRTELEAEQRRRAAERADQEESERQLDRMRQMRRDIEQQLQQKEAQRRHEELQRQATHQTMMERMAAEERLEQLTQAARRRRQLDHRRSVERLLDEARRQRHDELEQLRREKCQLERLEADRLRLVEQERRRLLERHAVNLVDFLPKGVFRDRKELEELGGRP